MSQPIAVTTVKTWFEQFLTAKQSAGLAPATLLWYRARFGEYIAWVEAYDGLGPLDVTAVENFLVYRQRTVSPSTVRANYRTLRVFYNWLVKRRYIPISESPIPLVESPKVVDKRMRYVTKEEFDRLYASIRGSDWTALRDRLLFTVLFYSGLRANEVLQLDVNDVERGEQVILVRAGKGNKERVVPYAPDVPALLDAYLAALPVGAVLPKLFVSNNGIGGVRGPLEYMGFKEMLRRRCKKAGMPRINLHAFRHGFAMWALNNGIPMSALSVMMGHSSVVVTESTYARWVTSALRREYTMAFERVTNGGAA